MADIKISQLSEAQLVSGTDVFPMTSNGVTMKAPASAIKGYTIGTTNNSDLGADVSIQIHNLHGQVSDSGDAYSPSKAYAVGDLCIYNNVLYRCITACSAGSWVTNQSCFIQDTLTNVANTLRNRYNFKYFDVTVPANSVSYNFSSSKPSDFINIICAMSVAGGGAILRQCSNSIMYFGAESIASDSVIRIFYLSN